MPLAVSVTGGNRHDVTRLMPLLDAIPRILDLVSRPRHRPRRLFADRGYDHGTYRRLLHRFKHPRTRYETPADLHLGLLRLARGIIWSRRLRTSF